MENVHGGDIYSYDRMEDLVDFSANVNPLGTPKSVIAAAKEKLSEIHRYPDFYSRTLRETIGAEEGIPKEWIICGNGAADLIYRLFFAQKPKKALVLSPGFSEYQQALHAAGSQVKHYYLNKETFCLEEDFLDVLTEDLDLICLCSPNNPTGKVIEKLLLWKISQVCKEKGIFLLLDECFYDFLDNPKEHTLLEQAKKDKNIFLLRAFTKMYGMAGIRLGYGICKNTDLLDRMYQCGPPWSVSIPAQAAGIAALQERDFPKKVRDNIKREKLVLYKALDDLNITYWKSDANYIFFKAAEGLKEALILKGILIRDCSNYHGLTKGYYRIAIKSARENQMLIQALREIL